MDAWEQWLALDRFAGASAQEVAAGLALIEGIRGNLLGESRLRPGQAVLELGCGAGEFLPKLLDAVGADGRVFGLDLSEGLCARARAAVAAHPWGQRCAVAQGDMRRLPYADGTLDAVLCRSVLQYAETDLPTVAAEIARVLRPGGRLAAFEVLPGDGTPLLPVPQTDGQRRAHAEATARWTHLPYALARADLTAAFGPPAFTPVTVSASVSDWQQPYVRDRFLQSLTQVPRPNCPALGALYTTDLPSDLRDGWESLLQDAGTTAQRGSVGYLVAERAPA